MKFLIVLTVLAVFCYAQSDFPPSNCKAFCNFCQEGFSLIQKNIELIETITDNQLIGLVDNICHMAPKQDIVNFICGVAKKDVVKGVNTFLDFIKKSTDPESTCQKLHLC